MPEITAEGGCLCGGVRYRVVGLSFLTTMTQPGSGFLTSMTQGDRGFLTTLTHPRWAQS